MVASPSYTLNHEEIEKALEEGIRFAEDLTPVRVEVDRFGHAQALVVRTGADEAERAASTRLPARTILVAAGTQPNTVLAREDAGALRAGWPLLPCRRRRGQSRHAGEVREPATPNVLLSRDAR